MLLNSNIYNLFITLPGSAKRPVKRELHCDYLNHIMGILLLCQQLNRDKDKEALFNFAYFKQTPLPLQSYYCGITIP